MAGITKQEQLAKLEAQQAQLAQRKAKLRTEINRQSRSADTKIKSFLAGSLLSLIVPDEHLNSSSDYKAQYIDVRRLYEQLPDIAWQLRERGVLRDNPANLSDQKQIVIDLEKQIRESRTQAS